MIRFLFILGIFLGSSFIASAQYEYTVLPLVAQVSGTFHGHMPCEDCRTIEVEMELSYLSDTTGSYTIRDKYMGKEKTEVISMSRRSGQFMVVKEVVDHDKLNLVMFDYDYPEKTTYCILKTDGNLIPLGDDKKPIEPQADCLLKKVKMETTEN